MIKPADFDPAKQYPVLQYVYGGPGSQTVTDAWGGSRYLWHQHLAQRGYIVVSVDNRGTGGRGRDFKKVTYLNLGERETADQIEAARYLATLPYVDASRLGIWGWSYGGYMTANTMMTEGSPFKAGISVAPVTDWKLYDTIYTERFMRTPQENPEGYRRSAPAQKAANLKGDLLIIHGTGDDNVHFQNTIQLVDKLQAANKQFTFMAYPNRNHSIAGGRTLHLYTLMTSWLTSRL
jgi:dipeptidyl-peptidase-4